MWVLLLDFTAFIAQCVSFGYAHDDKTYVNYSESKSNNIEKKENASKVNRDKQRKKEYTSKANRNTLKNTKNIENKQPKTNRNTTKHIKEIENKTIKNKSKHIEKH